MKMILFLAFAALGHTPTAPPVMPNANVVLVNEMADDCPAIKSSDGSDFDWGLVSDDADVRRCLLDLAQNLVTVLRCLIHMSRHGAQYILTQLGTPPSFKKTFRFGTTSISLTGCYC